MTEEWDLAGLRPSTRVYIRIGLKWPDAEGQVFAYFADCVDEKTGTVLVWNLTTGERFEAPLLTVRRRRGERELGWTRAATREEEQAAVDDLAYRIGKVTRVRRLD